LPEQRGEHRVILYHGSNIVLQLRLFLRGLISVPDLKKNLEYKELTHQISFHTEAAIGFLVKTEAIHG
jgi:hypothetical protein